MKNCGEIKNLIPLYIKNELDKDIYEVIKSHLDECSSCAKEHAKINGILSILSGIEEEELPVNFRNDLREKLNQVNSEKVSSLKLFVKKPVFRIISATAACMLIVFAIKGTLTDDGLKDSSQNEGDLEIMSMESMNDDIDINDEESSAGILAIPDSNPERNEDVLGQTAKNNNNVYLTVLNEKPLEEANEFKNYIENDDKIKNIKDEYYDRLSIYTLVISADREKYRELLNYLNDIYEGNVLVNDEVLDEDPVVVNIKFTSSSE